MHLYAHYISINNDANAAFTSIINVIKVPELAVNDVVINSFIEIMQNIAKMSNSPSKIQKFSVTELYNKKLSELMD